MPKSKVINKSVKVVISNGEVRQAIRAMGRRRTTARRFRRITAQMKAIQESLK